MVYPSGIEVVTQRIQEIRRHLDALDTKSEKTMPGEDAGSFSRILDEQLDNGTPSTLTDVSDIEGLIKSQSEKAGLDPSLVKAVVKAESGFNPQAVSSAGAKGLMQLMPSTAQSLGVRSILDPEENIEGGTKYLKSLMEKYHSVPKALAAYNAGPGAVDKYGGIPPYKETQTYVQRVLNYQHQYEHQSVE